MTVAEEIAINGMDGGDVSNSQSEQSNKSNGVNHDDEAASKNDNGATNSGIKLETEDGIAKRVHNSALSSLAASAIEEQQKERDGGEEGAEANNGGPSGNTNPGVTIVVPPSRSTGIDAVADAAQGLSPAAMPPASVLDIYNRTARLPSSQFLAKGGDVLMGAQRQLEEEAQKRSLAYLQQQQQRRGGPFIPPSHLAMARAGLPGLAAASQQSQGGQQQQQQQQQQNVQAFSLLGQGAAGRSFSLMSPPGGSPHQIALQMVAAQQQHPQQGPGGNNTGAAGNAHFFQVGAGLGTGSGGAPLPPPTAMIPGALFHHQAPHPSAVHHHGPHFAAFPHAASSILMPPGMGPSSGAPAFMDRSAAGLFLRPSDVLLRSGLDGGAALAGAGRNELDLHSGGGGNNKTRRSPSPEMPVRPLSAYNFFFSDERERILKAQQEEDSNNGENNVKIEKDENNKEEEEEEEDLEAKKKRLLEQHLQKDRTKRRPHRKTHGKIGFTSLSKLIGKRWRELPDSKKAFYREIAAMDMDRYQRSVAEYNNERLNKKSRR